MRLRLAVIIAIMNLCLGIKAQEAEYMYEIGAGIGASWAYGDVNRSDVMYNPGAAFDLIWRYNMNLRWAMAIDVSADALKGDSKDFDNAYHGGARFQYDTRLWQMAFRPEFSFWNYGLGSDYREKHRIAPFLTMGLGFGILTGDRTSYTGTETVKQDDSKMTVTIPLGLGVKWKMAPRWNAQLTCLFAKSFGDELDGVADPYGTGTKVPVNTDWTGTIKLSLTFDFKERCIECHNQNN